MKASITISLILAGIVVPPASAETEQLSSTNYFVLLDRGEEVKQPDGRKIVVGVRSHGNLVSDAGETTSIWCDVTNELAESGAASVGAFLCRRVDDKGDTVWVAGVQQLPSGSSSWIVLGGTGRYEGATGSGTTETVSQRADGYAWTSKSKGTLTVKKKGA